MTQSNRNESLVRTTTIEAGDFLKLLNSSTSGELAQAAVSYIQTNIVELAKYLQSTDRSDRYRHVVTYANDENGKIIGFRYFFFEPSNDFCHLFAVFVDPSHRKKGVATQLIITSLHEAINQGCTTFEIRLTQPTPEKDGLFRLYQRIIEKNSDQYRFIIYYWSKQIKPGRIPFDSTKHGSGSLRLPTQMKNTPIAL